MDDTPIAIDGPDADARGKKEAAKEADPYDFGAVEEALNDAARRVNAVWISFIVLCVYVFIATFTVTPAALFRDAPVKLPIFNADLPLKVYFVMAPVLVLVLHAYLIVLTQGLAEKIVAYEGVLGRSSIMGAWYGAGRKTIRSRLDNSIIVRATSARNAEARNGVDFANGVIAGLTMLVMPAALLLLTQLIFLPYQNELMSSVHRGFVIIDLVLCGWLLLSLRPWPRAIGRAFAVALVLLAAGLSVIAAFPGEWIYAEKGHWPHVLTETMFEGPPDPVDYVHQGGSLPFPNRLILPDNPKLAENAAASAAGVSLSVRGRNFRKAVFDRSNLARVDFSAADLTEASLQGAKLEGAKFECATPGRIIAEPLAPQGDDEREEGRDCANLERVSLWNANLDNASFREARMNKAQLGRASLKGALFRSARMNGVILQATALDNANFNGVELLGANFDWARGNNVNFSKARMTGSTFRQARLLAANFNDAGLQGAGLFDARLPAANFDNAHMQGVDLSGADLLAASFKAAYLHDATLDRANIQGASFKGAALRDASLDCAVFFRSDFKNTDIDQTIVTAPTEKRCAYLTTPGYTYYDTSSYNVADRYNLSTDALPKKQGADYGTATYYPDYNSTYYPDYTETYSPDADFIPELQHPENLTDKAFAAVLKRLTSALPDDAKARVTRAFERLKPDPKKEADDDAEKAFWTDWAKKSAAEQKASPDGHAKALAARLEAIACVAEGAPYVARGLLRAGRFDLLRVDEKMNDEEKGRIKRINERNLGILDRLKDASRSGASKCPGAIGLVEEDFPKPAPAK